MVLCRIVACCHPSMCEKRWVWWWQWRHEQLLQWQLLCLIVWRNPWIHQQLQPWHCHHRHNCTHDQCQKKSHGSYISKELGFPPHLQAQWPSNTHNPLLHCRYTSCHPEFHASSNCCCCCCHHQYLPHTGGGEKTNNLRLYFNFC